MCEVVKAEMHLMKSILFGGKIAMRSLRVNHFTQSTLTTKEQNKLEGLEECFVKKEGEQELVMKKKEQN
jgi:hypothetical protein